jgi:hypothetical protein
MILEAGIDKWSNFVALHLGFLNKFDRELDEIKAKPNHEAELKAWEAEHRLDYNQRVDKLIVGSITCLHLWENKRCYLSKSKYEFGKHSNRPKTFKPEFYNEVNALLRNDSRFTPLVKKEDL